jgi:hypothetical protein
LTNWCMVSPHLRLLLQSEGCFFGRDFVFAEILLWIGPIIAVRTFVLKILIQTLKQPF